MANNVNIPATGSGDATPKVSTDQVSADSSQVQNFQQVSVSGGVLTRNPTVPTSSAASSQVDGHSATIGALADASSASTLVGLLKNLKAALAGTLSTNIAQVAGATVAQGHGTAATALRVELPTDGTGVVGLAAGANAIGTVDTELPAAAALADGMSPTQTVPNVGAAMLVHDGNAGLLNRLKSIFNGLNTNGTGILAAGQVSQFDDVSPTAITENNVGIVRMSANRNQYQTIRDAAGNERGANVDSSGNLNVAATSLPLPTGAATAAKQPALGTVGSPSADFITVQGNASGTPIPVSATLAGTADVATTATITTTGSTTLTGLAGLSTLILSISSGTQSGVTDIVEGSNDTGTTWTTLATSLGTANTLVTSSLAAVAGNYMVQIAGYNQVRYRVAAITSGTYNIAMRASAGATNSRSVTLSGSNTVTANLGTLNGAATAAGLTTINTTLGTPMQATGGTVGLVAGTALVGKVGIDQTTPGTTNLVATELATGLTTFSNTALTNTKTAVKAGAGKVYGWMIHNPSAATVFIQVWNVAIGSITVGTTAPTWTIPIPAGASANVFTDRGITHSTEINIAATTTATGALAPATAAVVSLFYI